MSGNSRLDVVKAEFLGAEMLSWTELFTGFNKLYAITYSSSIDFITRLLRLFDTAEIIFGFQGVMSYDVKEVFAFQSVLLEYIRKNPKCQDLIARIDNETLRLYVARKQLSHEKIYLLESHDGQKRVITGFANLSRSAFYGMKRENICYMDGDKAFDWYMDCFSQLRNDSVSDISANALLIADNNENIDKLPIAQTVKVRKSLIIEPKTDAETLNKIRFALDVKNLADKFAVFAPKAEKQGKTLLLPETIVQTRRRLIEADVREKELRSEFPRLVVDIENHSVSLNDVLLDLHPSPDAIADDVTMFLDYMSGYEKFHGDVTLMQSRYFEFANWFFATPFMAHLRGIAVMYNQNLLPYPYMAWLVSSLPL